MSVEAVFTNLRFGFIAASLTFWGMRRIEAKGGRIASLAVSLLAAVTLVMIDLSLIPQGERAWYHLEFRLWYCLGLYGGIALGIFGRLIVGCMRVKGNGSL